MIHHSRLVYSERLFYFEGLVLPAGIEFVELGSVSPKGRDFFKIANFLGSCRTHRTSSDRLERTARLYGGPSFLGLISDWFPIRRI